MVDMPTIRGTGKHSFRQLVASMLGRHDRFPADLHALAEIQGLSLDSVLADGRSALAEYRYMSPLNPAGMRDLNAIHEIRGTAIESQLASAGAAMLSAIPADLRSGTAFTLDGIVDERGKVWFLEANCNPQLHPAFYDAVLTGTLLK